MLEERNLSGDGGSVHFQRRLGRAGALFAALRAERGQQLRDGSHRCSARTGSDRTGCLFPVGSGAELAGPGLGKGGGWLKAPAREARSKKRSALIEYEKALQTLNLQGFFKSGEGGIRTHVRLRAN